LIGGFEVHALSKLIWSIACVEPLQATAHGFMPHQRIRNYAMRNYLEWKMICFNSFKWYC